MQRRSHTSDIEGEWMEGLACGPSDEPSEGIVVSKPTARLMMLVNAAVWGSGYTMLKHVQESMPTQWVMFFRMAAAVLLMGVVFFPRLRGIRLRRYVVPGLALALTYWLGFLFQLKGLETTSPGRNSFFTDTYCVMVPFIVWAFTRKRPSWQHLVAALVCAVGIGLVSLSGGGGAELMNMSFGDSVTIVGAFFFALNLVLVGFVGKDFDAIALMLAEFVWCAPLFGSGALFTEGGSVHVLGALGYRVVPCLSGNRFHGDCPSVPNHRHTEPAYFRSVRDSEHGMHFRHAGICDFHR
ncbi:MAG: DMT family transporter [Bifidobacterium ruminantium]|nr:DMT family transporter [Bifidobacterium ruminantium]